MAEEKKVVDLTETIKVKGIQHDNGKKQKLIVGKEYDLHPVHAQNLVETGHAEYVDDNKTAKTKPAKNK